VFEQFSALLGRKRGGPIDELSGGIYRRADAVERHVRIRTQPVISDRPDIVGLGQEFAQLTTWCSLHKWSKSDI
jgi:hypothetical protein